MDKGTWQNRTLKILSLGQNLKKELGFIKNQKIKVKSAALKNTTDKDVDLKCLLLLMGQQH